jgi:hypothetical protein
MGFFELPPEPPEPPQPTQILPPWLGPPDNVLGVSVPLEPVLLVRTDVIAVSLGGFVAYTAGFTFDLAVRRRAHDDVDWFAEQMRFSHGPRRGREIPPEFFRFGIEFADGRKATNIGGWFSHHSEGDLPPEGPVLIEHGGSGGATRWDQSYWVWPLPPPGRVAFACEWPIARLELIRLDIDAASIADASKRAVTLWEPTVGPQSGATRYSRFSRSGELST